MPGACRPAFKSLWKASRNLLNLAVKSAQPLPILQAGNWRISHERTPVNCPYAGHRTVFTAGNG
ncbi:hypothetical protein EFER_3112 [Escherichia fergusonii ATCC 35469]|uniref:Uncharacterized protein n=1 Tax=Escherichia fergusonii (strain ATCC 35469 / DSM 13698 / CCUG 18766 / IAM 14443 / JCM 21226 / LMG 7866 / NBRC 102419 / NCTC 12128 / CDC 0568-73) TaxID=585054 RepID=B7LR02_ESCF3|nr:hypothetical protein EFER_3112 [Escherichia fergusonii ATCC 35469]